ncbi:unnamed protein product [Nippostrongylus brasiliensis]|uniref:ZP domain-containing protein n=1 Tax=Nippostrongylus brasiliensis TaxID=27835 RepID=A0A0N4YNT6_NIPBR|nr:unnamed protein product [Nippostrongylus brasiliensis]
MGIDIDIVCMTAVIETSFSLHGAYSPSHILMQRCAFDDDGDTTSIQSRRVHMKRYKGTPPLPVTLGAAPASACLLCSGD